MMTGGSTTHAGITFQDNVAAWVAVHVLAGQSAPALWGLAAGVSLQEVRLETEEPVDDVFVRTSGGGVCVINVKTNVSLSDNPGSPLASVIDQFVRQWLAGVPNGNANGSCRPVDSSRDRMLLAVSSESSKRLVSGLDTIIHRIIDLDIGATRNDIAKTILETEAYDKVSTLVRNSWSRHRGLEPSVEDIHALLSCVRIQAFALDGGGAQRNLAHTHLGNAVVLTPEDAASAWDVLCSACADFGKRQSGAGRTRLRDILREKGISLRSAPDFADDIRAIERYSDSTCESLSHLAELVVPGENGDRKIVVLRACVEALCESVDNASILVIGDPGAGKSGALHQAAKQLITSGYPVIQLAVDHLPLRTLRELDTELGIGHPFLDVLRNWESERAGFVFIDALDATRGGPAERVFRALIRRIEREVPNWNVVASIRTFDLRYSQELHSLFRGKPISARYMNDEFGTIRHIKIPEFSEEELSSVWDASPQLEAIYRQGKDDLRELIRTPFNLFLLSEAVRAGHDPDTLTEVATRAELLNLYWRYRVTNQDRRHHERETLLRNITERMITDRTLRVSRRDVPASQAEALHHLLSGNVLGEPATRTGSTDPVGLTFGHHVVFDYSVARLVLEYGRAPDFVERLMASEDSALMLAPAALMAFHELWLGDPTEHSDFWDLALRLASDDHANAICRMLAPRAAVDWIETDSDVARVIRAVGDVATADAATFLIKHLFGAVFADVLRQELLVGRQAGPWALIAKQLAEIDSEKIAYPTRALVAKLTSDPSQLTDGQRADLNAAARALLSRALDAEKYDSNIINPSIEAVAKTIAADVERSVQILGRLLEPDNFAEHADKELYWLTSEFDPLCEHATEFLVDIYRAAFGNPPPSRDEVTNLGDSRILSLTSNRQQDYEMILYRLAKKFPDFVARQPVNAAKALIATVEGHVALKEHTDNPIQALRIGNIDGTFQGDLSCVWWDTEDDDRGHDDAVKILNRFVTAMDALASTGTRDAEVAEVIETILQNNRLAAVWAALLRVAIKHPRRVGLKILDLLKQSPILECLDTQKPAGDLLTVLHPLLNDDQKREIEETVLAIENEHSRDILIGCLAGSDLVSEAAKSLLTQLKAADAIPANVPPYSITTGWGDSDDDWWLKEKGVDLEAEPNRSLKARIDEVKNLTPPDGGKAGKRAFLAENWEVLTALADALRTPPEIPNALQLQGWDTLVEVCGMAAKTSESPDDLKSFPRIEEMTLEALDHDDPESGDEAEAHFERSPSWGRPAPRIVAAQTIMLLARAKGMPDSNLAQAINKLVEDPSPAVRNQVISYINVICVANPELMWSLCEHVFERESNQGILRQFLGSFSRVMGRRLEWAADRLVALMNRYSDDDNECTHDLRANLAVLINRFWIRDNQAVAGSCVESWLADVIQYRSEISRTLTDLRDAITLGDPDSPTERDERIRTRAVEFFERVANAAAPRFVERAPRWNELSDSDRKEGENALKLLDTIATEVYFGSKAYRSRDGATKDKHDLPLTDVRIRFLDEMEPTLRTLGTVQYPSVTHNLLQTLEFFVPDDPKRVFDLITEAMLRGGAQGGYQQESLGTKLFVTLIQRYLVDYRPVLLEDPDRRRALIECLNLFVEAGWSEARRLVYDLPAMLR